MEFLTSFILAALFRVSCQEEDFAHFRVFEFTVVTPLICVFAFTLFVVPADASLLRGLLLALLLSYSLWCRGSHREGCWRGLWGAPRGGHCTLVIEWCRVFHSSLVVSWSLSIMDFSTHYNLV